MQLLMWVLVILVGTGLLAALIVAVDIDLAVIRWWESKAWPHELRTPLVRSSTPPPLETAPLPQPWGVSINAGADAVGPVAPRKEDREWWLAVATSGRQPVYENSTGRPATAADRAA